ncbi:MAG: hypothetical protein IJI46_06650 [Erysipelotrichaceae bacterium]|nr:hypothetical protein [Erysipelotrichaceae bacterium]
MVEIIRIDKGIIPKLERSVACIGYFDGFHRGHQKLIEKTVAEAKLNDLKAALICFLPDPIKVISKTKVSHLFPDFYRLKLAEKFGIEKLIVFSFTEEFMNMPADGFISEDLNRLNIEKLICGYDFSFGQYGKGNEELLKEKGNFETIVIHEETYLGSKISSTRIKETIVSGDFRLSEELLGFPYHFICEVRECRENGEKWLVKAKLVDPECLMLKQGYYSDLLKVEDECFHVISEKYYETGSLIYINEKGIDEGTF